MIPLIVLGTTGAYGAARGVKAAFDYRDAKKARTETQTILDDARIRVEKQREATAAILEDFGARKLRTYNGVIAEFIRIFSSLKEIEVDVNLDHEELPLDCPPSLFIENLSNEYKVLQDAGLGLGAGVGSGAALAYGAYGGAALLGTSSSGAAIASLSGVAATNATLAWLGGGSIAAGGGGMAMGTLVLGALVAGPAMAICGHIVGHQAKATLADAQSNLEKAKTVELEANLIESKLKSIQTVVNQANLTFSANTTQLRKSLHALKAVIEEKGSNYSSYSQEKREVVFRTVKLAQILKGIIDTPILDTDGNLILSAEKRFKDLDNSAD